MGTTEESWRARLEMLECGRLLGRCFAASRERVRAVAARRGVHDLTNLCGCPAWISVVIHAIIEWNF
jgi:hypothetical protein